MYSELMQHEAENLNSSEEKSRFAKRKSKLTFLNKVIYPVLSCTGDEYKFRLAKRVKEVSLNHGDLDWLPWERASCRNGELDGISKTIAVPTSTLDPYKTVRA